MLAQSRKTIAEFFVFVDFHLYDTNQDSPNGGVLESGCLFVRKQLEGGLIESLRYFMQLL